MGEPLTVVIVAMRWLHFASMATLLGGIFFALLVMLPSIETLAPDARKALAEKTAARFRPVVFAAIAGLVVSGLFNIFTKVGHSPTYHMLLGIKILLALHVFAVAILVVQPENPRRGRMMKGAAISGLIILAVAAYLSHIS